MKSRQILIFTLAIFFLFMALAPVICTATQVTPTYRWSPARPEQVIEQFFQAHIAGDYCAVKELMAKFSGTINLPDGGKVSVVGWQDYRPGRYLYIEDAHLVNITKLEMYSDTDENFECYQVVGDFKFKPFSPYEDGARTFYVYLTRNDIDVWEMYAPEDFAWALKTFHHNEQPYGINQEE